MASFFEYFPTLFYSNTAATNIIAKIRFEESVTKNLAVFYPYTITEGERPDQIAQRYYDDPSYDWVVYLSNDIIDPYHEWPMTQQIFDDYIKTKYGSTANAQSQISYFKVNYDVDDRVISSAAYDALAPLQKQYWSPIVGFSNTVINYERKRIDHVVETNKIVTLVGSFDPLTESDMIKQSNSVQGTVAFANSTTVVLKHVFGDWSTSAPVYTLLDNAAVNATITSISTTHESIAAEEIPYWTPVYQYEAEYERNEQNKHIRLLSNVYLNKIEADMKDLLSA